MRKSTQIILLPMMASLSFFILIGVAMYLYDRSFSFMGTNISRLGRPSMNPQGHWFMLASLVISNVFLLAYYRTLRIWMTDDELKNKVIRLIIFLCYASCLSSILLGIWNSDHHLPHKIFGGLYFATDFFIMMLACWLIYRHPVIHNMLIPFCLLSGIFDAIFLLSSGKASWAEWATVGLSFFIAVALAANTRWLEKPADERGVIRENSRDLNAG